MWKSLDRQADHDFTHNALIYIKERCKFSLRDKEKVLIFFVKED